MAKLNENQIEMLKKKHLTKNVYEYSIKIDDEKGDEDDNFYYFYLREPKFEELIILMNLIQKDSFSASDQFLKTLWIAGDKEILDDISLHLSALKAIDEIVKIKNVGFKKK